MAVELGRVVERGLRESRAIDAEALCIVSGLKVLLLPFSVHSIPGLGSPRGHTCAGSRRQPDRRFFACLCGGLVAFPTPRRYCCRGEAHRGIAQAAVLLT
jgi:hypothetical protein